MLFAAAGAYFGFAFTLGLTSIWVLIELLQCIAFGTLGLYGWRGSAKWLALGWALTSSLGFSLALSWTRTDVCTHALCDLLHQFRLGGGGLHFYLLPATNVNYETCDCHRSRFVDIRLCHEGRSRSGTSLRCSTSELGHSLSNSNLQSS